MAKDEKRITIKVDPETHKKARLKAVEDGRTLSDIIRDFLFSWLKSKEQPPK